MLSQFELDQAPKVSLAGRDFPIPHLAPRQQRIILPKLMSLMKFFTAADGKLNPLNMELTTAQFDDLLDVIYVALTRGTPNLTRDESADVIRYLRTLRPRSGSAPARAKLSLIDGSVVEGLVLNRSALDLQLLGDDRRLHLLRKNGDRYRAVTSQTDWPTYNGQAGGSRYSPLTQISKSNASKLTAKWIFSLPNTAPLQVTPVVAGGVMYVTSANECYALDAGTGRQIWRYQRPRTKGLIGNAAGGANRGVSVAGDKVFMVTDHAHLIALSRINGQLLWDSEMADYRQHYGATSAPLVVGNLVISGTAGGDEGVRGFVAAYEAATGKEMWRF